MHIFNVETFFIGVIGIALVLIAVMSFLLLLMAGLGLLKSIGNSTKKIFSVLKTHNS